MSSPVEALRTVPVTWWPASMRALIICAATNELAPVRRVDGIVLLTLIARVKGGSKKDVDDLGWPNKGKLDKLVGILLFLQVLINELFICFPIS